MKQEKFYISVATNHTGVVYAVDTTQADGTKTAKSLAEHADVQLLKLTLPKTRRQQAELLMSIYNRFDISTNTETVSIHENRNPRKPTPKRKRANPNPEPAPKRAIRDTTPIDQLHGDAYNKRALEEARSSQSQGSSQEGRYQDSLRNPKGYQRPQARRV